MSLAGLVRTDGRTDAHMDTKIVFANIVFLGVSHMTYCRETRDTKNAVRERVNCFYAKQPL
jgi:hypothetical protein